jgi:low temperature requirement protein LtrA
MAPELREQESVKPLELYFDLVFVLAFTQCTALMHHDPTWEGLAQGVLVLGVLWFAWVGYAWLTSVIEPEEGMARIVMFAAMAGMLVVALCVPEAFGDRALGFAIAYGVVRAGQVSLFMLASRDDPALRRSVVQVLVIGASIAVALLVGASFLDGPAQGALWGLAIAVDLLGPALFGLEGWKLVPGHFAERHNLIIILALGESIVALGIGAEVGLSAGVIAAAVLGIALSSALWWIYFDIVSLVTQRRLTEAAPGRERNALARDSYTYLHFPMVAGIVLVALALEETLAHVDEHLHTVPAFALLGGLAIYLLAHVALRLRNAGSVSPTRLGVAVLLLAMLPLALEISALATLAIVTSVLWAMIAYETRGYGDVRYGLRHGLDVEIESRAPAPGGAGAGAEA